MGSGHGGGDWVVWFFLMGFWWVFAWLFIY